MAGDCGRLRALLGGGGELLFGGGGLEEVFIWRWWVGGDLPWWGRGCVCGVITRWPEQLIVKELLLKGWCGWWR